MIDVANLGVSYATGLMNMCMALGVNPATGRVTVVGTDATLEEALAALLRSDKGVVGVRDGAQFVGVLTPNGIHKALRASLVEPAA